MRRTNIRRLRRSRGHLGGFGNSMKSKRIGGARVDFRGIKENRKLILLSAAFLIGLLSGVLVVRSAGNAMTENISDTFSAFISARTGQPFFTTFINSFLSISPFLLASFIAGLCIVGTPAVPLIACFRGLGIGLTSGYLYATYGLKGIGFFALIILPHALLSSVALILACRESTGFSMMLMKSISPHAQAINLNVDFKMYCLRYVFILGIFILSSLLDATMSIGFMRFFEF